MQIAVVGDLETGDIQAGSQKLILKGWCNPSTTHHVGDIHFLADGSLMISAGDGAFYDFADEGIPPATNIAASIDIPQWCRWSNPEAQTNGGSWQSQGDETMVGKLIQISAEEIANVVQLHDAANDNTEVDWRIRVKGLRNPFRWNIDTLDGSIWVGDVGAGEIEEITHYPNFVTDVDGQYNGGWPCFEGPDPYWFFTPNERCNNDFYTPQGREQMTFPTIYWNHRALFMGGGQLDPKVDSAVSSVAILSGENGLWPENYANSLWFTDYAKGGVFVVYRDGNNEINPDSVTMVLDSTASDIADLQEGPNGQIFVAQNFGGQIMRLFYAPPNQPPEVVVQTDVTGGRLPLAVKFDASGSYDVQGRELQYEWDQRGTGDWVVGDAVMTFEYNELSQVPVGVRVTCIETELNNEVAVNIFPGYYIDIDVQVDVPQKSVGNQDSVGYEVTGTDESGNKVSNEFVRIWTNLQHCKYGRCEGAAWDCHVHIITNPDTSQNPGRFIVPEHDYPHYIDITVEYDHPIATGYVARYVLELYPKEQTLKITSDPPGVLVAVSDEVQDNTPATFTYAKANAANVIVTAIQYVGDSFYRFNRWVDHPGEQTLQYTMTEDIAVHAVFDKIALDVDLRQPVPGGIDVQVTLMTAKITWNAVQNADFYIIYHRMSSASLPRTWSIDVVPAAFNSFEIVMTEFAQSHDFMISALFETTEGPRSAIHRASSETFAPDGFVRPCPRLPDKCEQASLLSDDWLSWAEGATAGGALAQMNSLGLQWGCMGGLNCEYNAGEAALLLTVDEIPEEGAPGFYTIVGEYCQDLSIYDSLVIDMTVPLGGDFVVMLDIGSAECDAYEATSVALTASDYVALGTYHVPVIFPLEDFAADLNRVRAISIVGFDPELEAEYRIHSIEVVRMCNEPLCVTTTIDNFEDDDLINGKYNKMGGIWHSYGMREVGSQGRQLHIWPSYDKTTNFFATGLANGLAIRDYKYLQMTVSTPKDGNVWLKLEYTLQDGLHYTPAVPLTNYLQTSVDDNYHTTININLRDFGVMVRRAAANPIRLWFEQFALVGEYQIDDIALVSDCGYKVSKAPGDATEAKEAETVQDGQCVQAYEPLELFAGGGGLPGPNAGVEGAAIGGGLLGVTPLQGNNYLQILLPHGDQFGQYCFDASAYTHVHIRLLNPYVTGGFKMYFQIATADCGYQIDTRSSVVYLDDHERYTGHWQDVYIPLSEFAGPAELTRLYSLVIEDMTPLNSMLQFEHVFISRPCMDSIDYRYIGSFRDQPAPNTTMQFGPKKPGYAPRGCYASCRDTGYQYFGLTQGGFCLCDNSLKTAVRLGRAAEECQPLGGAFCTAIYEGDPKPTPNNGCGAQLVLEDFGSAARWKDGLNSRGEEIQIGADIKGNIKGGQYVVSELGQPADNYIVLPLSNNIECQSLAAYQDIEIAARIDNAKLGLQISTIPENQACNEAQGQPSPTIDVEMSAPDNNGLAVARVGLAGLANDVNLAQVRDITITISKIDDQKEFMVQLDYVRFVGECAQVVEQDAAAFVVGAVGGGDCDITVGKPDLTHQCQSSILVTDVYSKNGTRCRPGMWAAGGVLSKVGDGVVWVQDELQATDKDGDNKLVIQFGYPTDTEKVDLIKVVMNSQSDSTPPPPITARLLYQQGKTKAKAPPSNVFQPSIRRGNDGWVVMIPQYSGRRTHAHHCSGLELMMGADGGSMTISEISLQKKCQVLPLDPGPHAPTCTSMLVEDFAHVQRLTGEVPRSAMHQPALLSIMNAENIYSKLEKGHMKSLMKLTPSSAKSFLQYDLGTSSCYPFPTIPQFLRIVLESLPNEAHYLLSAQLWDPTCTKQDTTPAPDTLVITTPNAVIDLAAWLQRPAQLHRIKLHGFHVPLGVSLHFDDISLFGDCQTPPPGDMVTASSVAVDMASAKPTLEDLDDSGDVVAAHYCGASTLFGAGQLWKPIMSDEQSPFRKSFTRATVIDVLDPGALPAELFRQVCVAFGRSGTRPFTVPVAVDSGKQYLVKVLLIDTQDRAKAMGGRRVPISVVRLQGGLSIELGSVDHVIGELGINVGIEKQMVFSSGESGGDKVKLELRIGEVDYNGATTMAGYSIEEFDGQCATQAPSVQLFNCGASKNQTIGGETWVPVYNIKPGPLASQNAQVSGYAVPIANAGEYGEELYQAGLFGEQGLAFVVDTEPGSQYEVTLHYAESWPDAAYVAGRARSFGVAIDGQTLEQGWSILEAAGDALYHAVRKTYTVQAHSCSMTIRLIRSSSMPFINAFEVRQVAADQKPDSVARSLLASQNAACDPSAEAMDPVAYSCGTKPFIYKPSSVLYSPITPATPGPTLGTLQLAAVPSTPINVSPSNAPLFSTLCTARDSLHLSLPVVPQQMYLLRVHTVARSREHPTPSQQIVVDDLVVKELVASKRGVEDLALTTDVKVVAQGCWMAVEIRASGGIASMAGFSLIPAGVDAHTQQFLMEY